MAQLFLSLELRELFRVHAEQAERDMKPLVGRARVEALKPGDYFAVVDFASAVAFWSRSGEAVIKPTMTFAFCRVLS